jgi:hypothetical protein
MVAVMENIPTKEREPATSRQLLTEKVLKKVIADLRGKGITYRDGQKYSSTRWRTLVAVTDKGRHTKWQYTVWGLVAEYIADTWELDDVSLTHEGTTYYAPYLGGQRLFVERLFPGTIRSDVQTAIAEGVAPASIAGYLYDSMYDILAYEPSLNPLSS